MADKFITNASFSGQNEMSVQPNVFRSKWQMMFLTTPRCAANSKDFCLTNECFLNQVEYTQTNTGMNFNKMVSIF